MKCRRGSGRTRSDRRGDADSTDPVAVAAVARIDRFFNELAHLGAADLERLSLPEPEVDRRAEVRRRIEDEATVAGLGGLLYDTRQRARDYVVRAYAADLYRPTWVGLNWGVSSGILADRLAVTTAVEDAAMAAVLDGVASAEIVDELREPFDLVSSMRPIGPPPDRTRLRSLIPVLAGAFLAVWILDLVFFGFQFGFIAVAVPVVLGVAIIMKASQARPDA